MILKNILITGANGQLGKELRGLEENYRNYNFIFTDLEELAIDDITAVKNFFKLHPFFACVNCAAYTAVDKAETEKDIVMRVNAEAVGNLAEACAEHKAQFVHISTDYVFDGNSSAPYKITDATNPINHYGASKLIGEQIAVRKNPSTIIIRTSWVYSEYGNNFVKTMMRLMKERESINVINDQIGSPTYAADLAEAIMKIVSTIDNASKSEDQKKDNTRNTIVRAPGIDSVSNVEFGIFHYSNEGSISWYEFAVAIKEMIGSSCTVNPIPTSQYPTPAKRPHFSLLDKSRIKSVYKLTIPQWRQSLAKCLERIQNRTQAC